MGRRKNISIVVILICLLVIGTLLFTSINNSNIEGIKYEVVQANRIDNSLVSTHEINKVLSKCYYSNKEFAAFNSVALAKNTPDLYQTNWVLNIIDDSGQDLSLYKDVIKERIYPYISKQKELSELDNTRMLVNIREKLGVQGYNKREIIELILKHYDKESCLFFLKEKNEAIKSKIVATNIVLEILVCMNETIKEIESVKAKLVDLYNSDEFFTKEDAANNVVNNGGCIISALYMLGITESDLDNKVKDRTDWADYWTKNSYQFLKYDFFSVSIVRSLIDINKFFGKTPYVDKNYLNSVFNSQGGLKGTSYNGDGFIVEPQYVDILIEICKEVNYTYPYKAEVNDYISETIECEFKKSSSPALLPIDNYFGIVLANLFQFTYDKGKVQNLLKEWYVRFVEEGSNIDNHDKLINLYYLLLSYNEFNLEFSEGKVVSKSVETYLSNLNIDDVNNLYNSILDFRIGLEIIILLKERPSGQIVKDANSFIEKTVNKKEVQNSIIISDLFQIAKRIGFKEVDAGFKVTVKDAIKNLYSNGGYKFKTDKGGEADIISTSRALKVIKQITELLPEEKEKIKILLKSLKIDKNVFKLAPSSTITDLRIIYEACSLSTLYSNLSD